ncbi:MAG: hypothetical protein ACRC1R_00750 [Cetobacterium sp.]|uniref:hypothetical protein n=1 Tax=Cetobacterium sp. TaxID=2071632 RepID=UPI003F2D234E
MVEFIFLNRDSFIIVGCLFIILGLALIVITEKISQIKTFIIGFIAFCSGIILLGSLITVGLFSKEYTALEITELKPNLKKEELMKFDISFLESVLNELREKKLKEIQEKKEKKIQEIINS